MVDSLGLHLDVRRLVGLGAAARGLSALVSLVFSSSLIRFASLSFVGSSFWCPTFPFLCLSVTAGSAVPSVLALGVAVYAWWISTGADITMLVVTVPLALSACESRHVCEYVSAYSSPC